MQYGLIFLGILILEYLVYIKDLTIFTAMMAQTSRYCKSLYSGIFGFCIFIERPMININGKMIDISQVKDILRNIMFGIFVLTYIKFCIDLWLTKDIKFYKIAKKYNLALLLFIFALSNFQQWYLVWLFATLPWQNSKTIKNIISISIGSSIANSVYMFNTEHYKYDLFFVLIIFVSFVISSSIGDVAKRKNLFEKEEK